MDIPKLVIPPKKYREESAVISMRLPKDMLRDIDSIVTDTGRTRNEVLMMAMEFALQHMDRGENDETT